MTCIVIVAPIGSTWAQQAESTLGDHRIVVARLFEASTLGLLVNAGGVRAIAIDARLALVCLHALRELGEVRVVAIDAWSDAALSELLGDLP